MEEKRKYNRVPYSGDVLVNSSIMVKGMDIGEGGIYVHTGRAIPLGTPVTLEFVVKGNVINAKAEVRSCQEAIGMGLAFTTISNFDKEVIRGLVSEHCCKTDSDCKKRVMLVDDDAGTRRMFKSKLVLEGYMVMEAIDGIEALALLKTERPDIILLDLFMEKMDGFKVLSFIKSSEELKRIPVVVLSARGTPKEIERAMSFGADGFLVKMMTSPVKLIDQVRKVLG